MSGWTYVLLECWCGRGWPSPKTGWKRPKKVPKCPLKRSKDPDHRVDRVGVPQEACLHVIGDTPKKAGRRCPFFLWGNESREFQQLGIWRDMLKKQARVDRLFQAGEKKLIKKWERTKTTPLQRRTQLNVLWDVCMKKVGGK